MPAGKRRKRQEYLLDVQPPPVDLFLNPLRQGELEMVEEKLRKTTHDLFDPPLEPSYFPPLFNLLTHTNLPCFSSDPDQAHMIFRYKWSFLLAKQVALHSTLLSHSIENGHSLGRCFNKAYLQGVLACCVNVYIFFTFILFIICIQLCSQLYVGRPSNRLQEDIQAGNNSPKSVKKKYKNTILILQRFQQTGACAVLSIHAQFSGSRNKNLR